MKQRYLRTLHFKLYICSKSVNLKNQGAENRKKRIFLQLSMQKLDILRVYIYTNISFDKIFVKK